MAEGSTVETLDTLIKYTMSKETAETIKTRFIDMSAKGESVSYMDCVLFDAALEVLGMEQEYYGIPDDEWQATLKQRAEAEKRFSAVKVIDVTDKWREVLE